MPARSRLSYTNADDPVYLAKLASVLLRMDEDGRARFMGSLDEDGYAVAQRALSQAMEDWWRATPATMAHHLEPDSFELYPYWVLLGEMFAGAFKGTVEPHQQWWLPSQYGKTSLLGNWGPVWALDMNPRLRLMYVSYDADKAVEEAGKARDICERHVDRLRFRLRADKRARGMWSTPQGGGLYAVGINGGITGYPADGMLLDDLLKGWVAAHSETTRNSTFSVYRSQVRMRMQSEFCPIILGGTRWHEDDPQARLRKLEAVEPDADKWKVIRLAAIAEAPDPHNDDPVLREPDPLGREPGEVLEPRRFSEREVRTRRATLGSYLATAIEQQRPAPEEGGEVKRAWFKIAEQLPPAADEWLSSWDMKLKDKESGDFVVGQVWARTGSDYWLMDQLRGQWAQATTTNAICLAWVRWPDCRRHIIENTGYGPEVMQSLRQPVDGYVLSEEMRSELGMTEAEAAAVQEVRRRGMPGLIANNPRGDKRVRMRAESGVIEAGNVHLPANASWLGGYLDEMAAFPNGSHDDQVDSTSQALSKLAIPGSVVESANDQLPPTAAAASMSANQGGRYPFIVGYR